jgi:hypothetical protein
MARIAYQQGDKSPEPTPVLDRFHTAVNPFKMTDAMAGYDIDPLTSGVISPLSTAADVVNDVNTRVANLRRDYAPEEAEYEIRIGDKVYKGDDAKESSYWNIEGGIYSEDEIGYAQDLKDGRFRMPDGKVVSVKPDGTFESISLAYKTLPDGTVTETDGKVPRDLEGRIHRRQTNAGFLGHEDPRYPWQDTAGNNPIFDEEWSPKDLTLLRDPTAALSSSADLFLASAPYFIPRYRYMSAAARSLPAVSGYDTNTYQPEGRGLENLGAVGLGKYEDRDMTRAQLAGTATEPWIDAWAEMASGQAIGGIEKSPLGRLIPQRLKDTMSNTWYGRIASGVLGEAIEEAPAVLPGALSRDSIENFGREGYWDPETEVWTYHGPRFATTPEEFLEGVSAGGLMGGTIAAGQEALRIPAHLAAKKMRGGYKPSAPARVMTDDEIRARDPRFKE